jgi:hypothetical protein
VRGLVKFGEASARTERGKAVRLKAYRVCRCDLPDEPLGGAEPRRNGELVPQLQD